MKRFLTYIIITLYLTSMSITADAADQVPQGTESYHVYTEITVTASQLSVPTAATMPSQLPADGLSKVHPAAITGMQPPRWQQQPKNTFSHLRITQ